MGQAPLAAPAVEAPAVVGQYGGRRASMGDPGQNSDRPACVSESSAQKLLQGGWIAVRQSQDRTDIPDVQTEISARMVTIGNMDKTTMISEGGPPSFFWPKYSLTFPDRVRVGEQFEIVLNYTFIIPGLDDDDDGVEFLNYEEPESVCDEVCLEGVEYYGAKFHIERNAYVALLNDTDYVMTERRYDKSHIPVRQFEFGTILPILNNTHPQQKTFTFVINEPDTEYPFGHILIEYNVDGNGRIHFYVEPGGTVRLSDEPIAVAGERVPRLTPNLPEPTFKVLPKDPLSVVNTWQKPFFNWSIFLT